MIILYILILAWMVAGCAYWLAVLYLTIRITWKTPLLEAEQVPEREEWPKVSVIVTAHDGEENMRGSVAARLQDGYPDLEFILVDDRSSDATPRLMDELAAKDERVKTIHIHEVPGGWLAKVYAMQRGIEESSGEWLAFSDADASVNPGAMARAVSYCDSEQLDFLAVIPELYRSKTLTDSVSQVMLRIMLLAERVWKVEDANSSAAVGSPSFALVRRALLEEAGGFTELRMEPSQDEALARSVKAAGGRSGVVNGRGYVGSVFYRSLREAAVDMERSVYTSLGNFNLMRVFFLALLFFALEFGPYLFFSPLGIPYHDIFGTVAVALGIVVSIIICRWMRLPLAAAFFFPVDLLIVTYSILRAGIVVALQGGLWWQDAFYSNEMLRMGRRFSLR